MSVANQVSSMNKVKNIDFTPSLTRSRILYGMTILSLLSVALVAYLALAFVGADQTQGDIQRIFYIHVASFSGAGVAFFVTVIGGILYLKTRNPKWDTLALAGVEVGLMLSLITLTTGMIWGKPIWNTYWTWDPRLTSAAIMVLTYAAYLMLRNGFESMDRQRVFAAMYGILAFSTVAFTFMVIRIRPDTIHPTVIGTGAANAEGGFSMSSNMRLTLSVASIVACCVLTPTLMWWRIRLQNMLDHIAETRAFIMDKD